FPFDSLVPGMTGMNASTAIDPPDLSFVLTAFAGSTTSGRRTRRTSPVTARDNGAIDVPVKFSVWGAVHFVNARRSPRWPTGSPAAEEVHLELRAGADVVYLGGLDAEAEARVPRRELHAIVLAGERAPLGDRRVPGDLVEAHRRVVDRVALDEAVKRGGPLAED